MWCLIRGLITASPTESREVASLGLPNTWPVIRRWPGFWYHRQKRVRDAGGDPEMHVRCPHCHNPIEVVGDDSFTDLECPSCGSHFPLVGAQPTASYYGNACEIR